MLIALDLAIPLLEIYATEIYAQIEHAYIKRISVQYYS